jgi:hypothetical protein
MLTGERSSVPKQDFEAQLLDEPHEYYSPTNTNLNKLHMISYAWYEIL